MFGEGRNVLYLEDDFEIRSMYLLAINSILCPDKDRLLPSINLSDAKKDVLAIKESGRQLTHILADYMLAQENGLDIFPFVEEQGIFVPKKIIYSCKDRDSLTFPKQWNGVMPTDIIYFDKSKGMMNILRELLRESN